MSRSRSASVADMPFGERLTCPSSPLGAVATKYTGCAWTKSRSRPSIASYTCPMRRSLPVATARANVIPPTGLYCYIRAVKLTVDAGSPVPPYEQVRTQIAAQARAGELAAGTRLPTVRQLAGELGLAVNTVARAYRELEQAKLVETRGRHGTFVTAAAAGVPGAAERLAAHYAAAMRP